MALRSFPFRDNYTVGCGRQKGKERKLTGSQDKSCLCWQGLQWEGMIWRGLGNRVGLQAVLRKEGFTEEVTFGLGLEG